jgi:SAM-dependent methyltransferase
MTEILQQLEADTTIKTRDEALSGLRALGLGDFGDVLWASPLPDYPKLAHLLPPMSSNEVQFKWTGASGEQLLVQSLDFVRSVSENYTKITSKQLTGSAVLDYGCGYARVLRLFSYYTLDLWGVDAWESSLEESLKAGFSDRRRKINPKPEQLPFHKQFDLVFAFSIFTH